MQGFISLHLFLLSRLLIDFFLYFCLPLKIEN